MSEHEQLVIPSRDGMPQELQRALVRLTQRLAETDGSLEKAFNHITSCAALELNVERVSLWLYSDGRNSIRCHDLYTSTDQQHSSGAELFERDYPAYFDAIATERIIAAHDAHRDPQTAEFSNSYLTPLGISSMLDAPIRLRGKLVGVVCHEHTAAPRTWSLSEQNFAASIGDFAAQAMEAAEHLTSRRALARAQRLAHVGNWILDPATSDWRCSLEMARILGYESADAIPDLESFLQHVHEQDAALFRGTLEMALCGADTEIFEHRMVTSDGTVRFISCHIDSVPEESGMPRPLRDSPGTLNGTSHDITELALMRREEAARQAAQDAYRALQQSQTALKKTLAALAHDVRTPIASLKLGLDRMNDSPEAQNTLGPALRSEVEYLDALFANLISLVRIDADAPTSTNQEVDLAVIVERTQTRYLFLADDKKATIELALPGEQTLVYADVVSLEQAIGNLTHNALKYARKHVALILFVEGDKAIVQVRDDGPGFLGPETEQVTQRYFRGQLKPTYSRNGMGLGLTIAADVVARLDGALTIGNHPDGGGLVELRLPLCT